MAKRRPPGKWIDDLSPGLPVVDAARLVVDLRLQGVEMLLPPAVEHAKEDIEHIHQLRVATRRADSALRVFGDCFKRSRLKKARRRLRRIRRAAGEAREGDVHGLALREQRDAAGGLTRAVLDDLVRWIDDRRRVAQVHVHDAADQYPVRRLRRSRNRLIDSLREPARRHEGNDAPMTFRELAHAVVSDLVMKVHEAAARDLEVFENLHELRITSKQLRYAMEVFRPCFKSGFKTAYGLVESIQERLGVVNDDHEMAARIQTFIEETSDDHDAEWLEAAAALRRSYLQRCDDEAAAFLADWSTKIGPEISILDRLIARASA